MTIIDHLFFEFEKDKSTDTIRYLVSRNDIGTNFYTIGIDKLGPRPLSFPKNTVVERIDEEFRALHLLLNQIRDSNVIFCKRDKLKQLYYRSKKFGIRESYIPGAVRLRKIRSLKIPYRPKNFEIAKLLDSIKELKNEPMTHWNILHKLYLEVKLNSFLINNNGFSSNKGIYEISLKREKSKNIKRKSPKRTLWGYADGM